MKTKTDLENYVKVRIFTNGVNAIKAARHQEALLAVVEQTYVDLASTSEELTGEVYDGKPVYAKCIDLTNTGWTTLTAGSKQITKKVHSFSPDLGGRIGKYWIDNTFSYAKINGYDQALESKVSIQPGSGVADFDGVTTYYDTIQMFVSFSWDALTVTFISEHGTQVFGGKVRVKYIKDIPAVLNLKISSSSNNENPTVSSVPVGGNAYLFIRNASNESVSRPECTLTSNNPSVATISQYGTIVGVSPGMATLKAVKGNAEGTINITVN